MDHWGNLPPVESATDPDSLSGWNHWCFVVDDTSGYARWYLNGVPDGTLVTFPPGSFAFGSANGSLVVGSDGSNDPFTRYFEMDDFRVYGRALLPAEVAAATLGENASASTFGTGCPGPTGIPRISASGGLPSNGNSTLQIDVENLEGGAPAVIVFGTEALAGGTLPYELTFVMGAACYLETMPVIATAFATPGSTSGFPTPRAVSLPAAIRVGPPPFPGDHVYAQVVVLGSMGAATPALDIDIQP